MQSLAYFKAKQQFYYFNLNDSQDVDYVMSRYFENKEPLTLTGKVDKKTFSKQKSEILTLLDYQAWSPMLSLSIKTKLESLLRYYPKPHNTIRQLLLYFENERIIVPSYRILQDLFSAANASEERRLNEILTNIPTYFPRKNIKFINERRWH